MGKWGLLGVFIFGFLSFAGMNSFFKATNTVEFCTSCHTMQQNFTEYKESPHYKNHAGVRATCADCHVPKSTIPKIITKIVAAKDVYHEIIGTIDTPEKFEAHRWEMASRVWDKMKKSDSRECRSCHSWNAMMFPEQDKSASKKHQRAKKEGKTCIDCHKGIVHEEPDEPEEETSTQQPDSEKVATPPATPVAKQTEAAKPAAPKPPATPLAPSIQSTDATDAGALTDVVNSCNTCHGKDGNTQEAEIPSISGASSVYLHDALVAFKGGDRIGDEYQNADNEITDMNKLTADLSDEQLLALSEYYADKTYTRYNQSASETMAEVGAGLFDKKCEKCHADGGTDPEDDAGIIAGQPKNYLVKQFSHFDDGSREMPKKMAKKFKKLDDQQKQQIIEYLIK